MFKTGTFCAAVLAGLLSTTSVIAQESGSEPRLVRLGEAAGVAVPEGLATLDFTALPETGAAEREIFAAHLAANPVSTFRGAAGAPGTGEGQLFLVARLGLAEGGEGLSLRIGEETVPADAAAGRLRELIGAIAPASRAVAFFKVDDPSDSFAHVLPELRATFDALGFGMSVMMVGQQGAAQSCAPAELHHGVIAGLPDRAPFGDGDGIASMGEVERFLQSRLGRLPQRDGDCAPRYSLILRGEGGNDAPLVAVGPSSRFEEIETQLAAEKFESLFLMESQKRADVETFLASCRFCPNEDALEDRIEKMAETERLTALEEEVWTRVKADAQPARLEIYLENCTLCLYRDEAEERIASLNTAIEAREEENLGYAAAREGRDLDALRLYVAQCLACDFRDEAEGLVGEIESDGAYREERALLARALETKDPDALARYLETCTVCDGEDEVAALRADLAELSSRSEPCVALAGLPRQGGPRKLEDIDTEAALRVCEGVAKEFPADGMLATLVGRIKQADGDFDAARAAYTAGIERDVAEAYGLMAYAHYAPMEGEADLDTAHALAQEGYGKGDWLSGEILAVLYSKNLIEGHDAADAYEISLQMAEDGNPLAQFFTGYYYLNGVGVPASDTEAALWLRRSSNGGHTGALPYLAELYETGRGVPASARQAADLYWAGLRAGDPTSLSRLTTQLRERDREVVRFIQQELRELGSYRGATDGIAGPGTERAVRAFVDSLAEQS